MAEINFNTDISLAEVRDTVDVTRNGSFLAYVNILDQEQIIQYVSPYASNGAGAFISIPEVGTLVLVCQPTRSGEWYYLGSTFSPEPEQVEGAKIPDADLYPLERANSRVYEARGVPMRQQFKGSNGGGLTMSEEYNPTFISKKTELTSEVNKKVSLIDSPAIDSIILDSGNGSRITLSDNPQNQSIPSRAIQVETVGPQKYINVESQTDVVVVDGRELQVLNNSTGANAPEGDPDKAGNVNIQSKWKDINVFTQAEQGRIFIECLNEGGDSQLIQIETNGTGGAIVIKTKGDIRLDAGGNIDLTAGNQIRMKSGADFSVGSGGAVQVKSSSDTNIDGDKIHLNSGNASPSTPSIQGQESTYGNTGITTY